MNFMNTSFIPAFISIILDKLQIRKTVKNLVYFFHMKNSLLILTSHHLRDFLQSTDKSVYLYQHQKVEFHSERQGPSIPL